MKIPKIHSTNWLMIQEKYDSGLSYEDLKNQFGLTNTLLHQAKLKGFLKSRTSKDGYRLFIDALSVEKKEKHFSHKGNPNNKMGGYRAGAGRSKKYYTHDSFGGEVCLQSSYEKRVAEILDELQIRWIRPKYLKYDDKKYFPDFFLVDKDIYLDPKNDFLAVKDEEKIKKVCEQNNVIVLILTQKQINKDFLMAL